MATDSLAQPLVSRIAYQHKEWLGLLQPVGLVVSPIALERAGAIIDRSKLIVINHSNKQGLMRMKISSAPDRELDGLWR